MENTKRCPYCGEEIMANAKKCRHCGEWLVEEKRQEIVEYALQKTDKEKNKKKKKEELLGCIVAPLILSIIPIIILLIAHFTVPPDERHEKAIIEDVRSCIKDKTETVGNIFGNGLGTLASIALSTSESNEIIKKEFDDHNSIKVNKYWFWSIGKIINSNNPEGATVSFGIFGFIIPFVSWDDFKLADNQSSSNNNSSESDSSNNIINNTDSINSYEQVKPEITNTESDVSQQGNPEEQQQATNEVQKTLPTQSKTYHKSKIPKNMKVKTADNIDDDENASSTSTGFHLEKASPEIQKRMEEMHNGK